MQLTDQTDYSVNLLLDEFLCRGLHRGLQAVHLEGVLCMLISLVHLCHGGAPLLSLELLWAQATVAKTQHATLSGAEASGQVDLAGHSEGGLLLKSCCVSLPA